MFTRNAFDDTLCNIDLFGEESASGCFYLDGVFPVLCHHCMVKGCCQAAGCGGEDSSRVAYSLLCCDVSSLLQHGAHELKNPWPWHTPVWNLHCAVDQGGSGVLWEQRMGLCIPKWLSSDGFQLRLPLVMKSGSYHVGFLFLFQSLNRTISAGPTPWRNSVFVIMFDHSRWHRTKSVFLFGFVSIVSLLGLCPTDVTVVDLCWQDHTFQDDSIVC